MMLHRKARLGEDEAGTNRTGEENRLCTTLQKSSLSPLFRGLT